MIDKVLNEIIEAEERAELIKKEASERAKDISVRTLAELDALKAESEQKIKDEVKKIYAAADAEAESVLKQKLKAAEKEADELIKIAERNTLKVVADIAAKLTQV